MKCIKKKRKKKRENTKFIKYKRTENEYKRL